MRDLVLCGQFKMPWRFICCKTELRRLWFEMKKVKEMPKENDKKSKGVVADPADENRSPKCILINPKQWQNFGIVGAWNFFIQGQSDGLKFSIVDAHRLNLPLLPSWTLYETHVWGMLCWIDKWSYSIPAVNSRERVWSYHLLLTNFNLTTKIPMANKSET